MTRIINVRDTEHFKDLVARKDLTAFIFSATWCGPCQQIAQDLERLSIQYYPTITFAKVDADDHQDILEKCNVAVLPSFMFCRDGSQVGHFIGADIASLKDELKLLATPFDPQLLPK
jgi:thioredoxin 1